MPPVAAPSCLGNVSARIAARDRGTSGRGLANKAFAQVWSFGADTIVTWPVTGLNSVETGYLLRLADGSEVQARSVVITTGVSYRRLKVPGLSALVGAGVYCGAAGSEARAWRDGGLHRRGRQLAGQAAVNLARYAHQVTLLVRRESFRHDVQYLIMKSTKPQTLTFVTIQMSSAPTVMSGWKP